MVIVQDDRFDMTKSVTVCALTSNPVEAPVFRPDITPDEENGLREPSRLMVDKITTLSRIRLGHRVGRLADADMLRLNRAIAVFLGITRAPRS